MSVSVKLHGWTQILPYGVPRLSSFCVTTGRQKQSKSAQGLADTCAYPELPFKKQLLPNLPWGVKHQGNRESSLQWALWPAPGDRHKAAYLGCPEINTPVGRRPMNSFPGSFLRARGEQPLLRPPSPTPTAASLCGESGPWGSPSDCPPEAHTGARELAWEASKILMHSVVRSCHTRLWQIIPDACRGKMEL